VVVQIVVFRSAKETPFRGAKGGLSGELYHYRDFAIIAGPISVH